MAKSLYERLFDELDPKDAVNEIKTAVEFYQSQSFHQTLIK
jgi:hypothetical protein